jgi:hypothetical protein
VVGFFTKYQFQKQLINQFQQISIILMAIIIKGGTFNNKKTLKKNSKKLV